MIGKSMVIGSEIWTGCGKNVGMWQDRGVGGPG